MRSLILFLGTMQLTAAALFFLFEMISADDPVAEIAGFALPVQVLLAAVVLTFLAFRLARWDWSRWIALLVVLILPILFVAQDMGLSVG